jgi:hypothetical protein
VVHSISAPFDHRHQAVHVDKQETTQVLQNLQRWLCIVFYTWFPLFGLRLVTSPTAFLINWAPSGCSARVGYILLHVRFPCISCFLCESCSLFVRPQRKMDFVTRAACEGTKKEKKLHYCFLFASQKRILVAESQKVQTAFSN